MAEIDANGLEPREINRAIQKYLDMGEDVIVKNPKAKHNLGIKLTGKGRVHFEGSTGYYTGGFMNGPELTIERDTGWYLGDNMHGGRIIVKGNTGSNVAPSMINGEVIVKGNSGSRVGLGLKGGIVVVEGKAGMLCGKMMLGGTIILLGKAGDMTGESMYGGRIFLFEGPEPGSNVKMVDPEKNELDEIRAYLKKVGIEKDIDGLKKIVPAGKQHKYVLFRPMHRR